MSFLNGAIITDLGQQIEVGKKITLLINILVIGCRINLIRDYNLALLLTSTISISGSKGESSEPS